MLNLLDTAKSSITLLRRLGICKRYTLNLTHEYNAGQRVRRVTKIYETTYPEIAFRRIQDFKCHPNDGILRMIEALDGFRCMRNK